MKKELSLRYSHLQFMNFNFRDLKIPENRKFLYQIVQSFQIKELIKKNGSLVQKNRECEGVLKSSQPNQERNEIDLLFHIFFSQLNTLDKSFFQFLWAIKKKKIRNLFHWLGWELFQYIFALLVSVLLLNTRPAFPEYLEISKYMINNFGRHDIQLV